MTPQEKAKDLFCKMYGCEINADLKDIYLSNGDGFFIAKDCALIAVDEIINIGYWSFMESGGKQEQEYWDKVKQEIQKL
jgi:hypothetical protein